ncbi:IS200/IS605 family transposase [Escherichia coli]|nr:IS200/IS605 family transposase [Escherichia coli]EEU9328788.1 IS200/IS605 family transposase [Escherichia coli]EFE7731147.1 IS200/IS605 family transposase [Escherichia coli]EFE7732745.1 IS200/IS605 family transposase [Escherichia coli]EFN5727395.1 IS200/IS605 family transposase [Escherichia coli]
MTSQVTDVLEAVQSFIAKGYDREYRVKDGNLVDLELGSTLDACSIRVDAALRLESGDDGEDASNIYAITDPATEHPKLAISNLVSKLKGKSSYMIRREYWDRVKTMLWGNHFWSPSYCVVSCGGVALDVVREYINNQNEPPSEKAMKTSQALKQRKE